jgi:hypothetical protein
MQILEVNKPGGYQHPSTSSSLVCWIVLHPAFVRGPASLILIARDTGFAHHELQQACYVPAVDYTVLW